MGRRGGTGRRARGGPWYRVTHSFSLLCVHTSRWPVRRRGLFRGSVPRGGSRRASYAPLSAFIRGLHALTSRCHALKHPPSQPPHLSRPLSLSLFRSSGTVCVSVWLACTSVDIPLPKSHGPSTRAPLCDSLRRGSLRA